jgi:hypothetical protein
LGKSYHFASARRPTLLATVEDDDEPIAFLKTEPNAIVAPIHLKAIPVILTTPEEI